MGVPRRGDLVTAALSPDLSWLVFGGWLLAVVLIVAWFSGETRKTRQHDESWTFTEPADPQLRIFGGIYDHEGRGDFDD